MLYLRLDESKIIESEEVQPGIALDYNDNKQVVGVEILRVKSGLAQTTVSITLNSQETRLIFPRETRQ
jgi:uncharacterized protein YuzE